MSFVPNEHETLSELKPIVVNYKCELCNEGNMVTDSRKPVKLTIPGLITHVCNNCNGVMKLPKMYPYLEWVTKDEYENFINKGFLDKGEK